MNKFPFKLASFFIIGSFFVGFFGFVVAADEESEETLPERKIVIFKEGVSDAEKSAVLARANGVKIKKLKHGEVVMRADKDAEIKIAEDARVAYIEPDFIVEALAENGNGKQQAKSTARTPAQPAQVLSWGIDRVDAEKVWPLGETGSSTKVAIIDTGISTSHPDLAGNIKGGMSAVAYTSSFNDDNGHGSHVAGIVGAVNNTIGVIGAAPSVSLYGVKVLDRNGSGYLSDVIEGIDWSVANGMRVINMSLGCDCPSQAMHDAVVRAANAGVVVVAAAGNSGGAVSYPAAYPEVIAVAATDASNAAPYWSSRGSEVDLAAPGVSIYSTYKGVKYATLSGTSMASPHVAGVAALALKKSLDTAYDEIGNCVSTYDVNCDGAWQSAEIANILKTTAVDLGVAGPDDIYGYGLVNAFSAFTF